MWKLYKRNVSFVFFYSTKRVTTNKYKKIAVFDKLKYIKTFVELKKAFFEICIFCSLKSLAEFILSILLNLLKGLKTTVLYFTSQSKNYSVTV